MKGFIPRRLHYAAGTDLKEVGHEVLLDLRDNIILLGEAGSGKTRLTEWLGDVNAYTRCTARQLINGVPRQVLKNAKVLVIDALDEVAAKAEGDNVDLVLRALREIDFPRFILSCRSAEWRAATMREAIREQYGDTPVELEIAPLTDEDARTFLASYLNDADRAAEIVRHFRERGLADWLGNPQTLAMLGDVTRDEKLPNTASALFARYVELAWFEHSDRRPEAPLQKLGKDAALDALGAGFAALILTGSAALSDEPRHLMAVGDLPRTEVQALPGGNPLEIAIKSRVCIGSSSRRTFQHKRIGEYLGARWLAKYADTPTKRTRLLSMLRSKGVVPANLRGLHSWLALDPNLAESVIRTDPAGVIEYGDADDLPEGHGRVLLDALAQLVERNPLFSAGWNPRARSLVKGELLDESLRVLIEQSGDGSDWQYPFALRYIIASQLAERHVVDLRHEAIFALLFDNRQEFNIRLAAGRALAIYSRGSDWAIILERLRLQSTVNSCRLAVELLDDIDFRGVSDRQIVELILAHEGVTISYLPKSADDHRTVGTLHYIEFLLPDQRIDGVLDEFYTYLEPFTEDRSTRIDSFTMKSLIGGLVCRRLALTDEFPLSDPVALWRWLRPLEGHRGYSRSKRDEVAEWLKSHDGERRAIQRHILIEMDVDWNVSERHWRLVETLPSAAPDSNDIAVLLDGLDASDERWRDLLTLIYHDDIAGAEARAAAKRFVANRPDMLRWIDDLAVRKPQEWELRERDWQRKRRAKEAVKYEQHRNSYLAERDKLVTGEIGSQPAQAYLGHFSDLPKDSSPHERIALWLGKELQDDALKGFEAFLTSSPPKLTADEIAESWSKSQYWPQAWVLVAALMERLRVSDKPFEGLADERLIAAMLQIEHGLARSEEANELGSAIETELKARGAYEAYARLLIEPSLRERRSHISGLYSLMRTKEHGALAAKLAFEWLTNFPKMAADIEEELIDCLIRNHDKEALRTTALLRLDDKSLTDRSRFNWQAVSLLTDFDRIRPLFETEVEVDPQLIWTIRNRFGGQRHRDEVAVALSLHLMAWIVRSFRVTWPYCVHPSGLRSGDQNPGDASDYLLQLIGQIGDDPSDEAQRIIADLCVAPSDGYSDYLRRVATEQEAKRAELAYRPPTVSEIATILDGAPPATHMALQYEVLAALERVQARVRSDPTDCWRGFYLDDRHTPKSEEDCTDHIANLLGLEAPGINFDPELHVGSDREVDIACSVGKLRIPIEAKGQWNADLWTAAEWQLGDQQAVDHQAAGHGIYLVYWFGPQTAPKRLRKPPRGAVAPATPKGLQVMLEESLVASGWTGLEIFVLDLTR